MRATGLLSRPALDEPHGSLRDYVSPSRLNLWLRCPLAFELKYVRGITVAASGGLLLGQAVHSVLAHYYRHRQLGALADTTELAEHLGRIWPELVDEGSAAIDSPEAAQRLRDQVMSLVKAYLSAFAKEDSRRTLVLAVEAVMQAPLVDPFTGNELGIPLLGITDLVLETEDGPVIVDFKSAPDVSGQTP